MARNVGSVLVNNLSRGLITEATGLNYPDNAVIESWNTKFQRVGSVTRRSAYDLEEGAEIILPETSLGLVKEFVWQSVALTGGFTFLVMQIGWVIHFFELTVETPLSASIQPASFDLRNFQAPGSSISGQTPASFSSGAGFLFIAHPSCDPVVVRFNDEENVFEVARITLMVRDTEGVDDGLSPGDNPTSLSNRHHYNLKNQGWYKPVRVGTRNNELSGGFVTEPNYPLIWDEL